MRRLNANRSAACLPSLTVSLRSLAPLAVVLLAGCDSGDPEADRLPLVPLAVGNTWTYRAIEFDRYGVPIDTVERDRSSEVVADTVVAGWTWYREAVVDEGTGDRGGEWWAVREDGLWSDPGDLDGAGYLRLPYPAPPGATGAGRFGEAWTLASTDTTVTVPAGTFRCHHYRYRSVYMVYDDDVFYAPGIGRVLSVRHDYFGGVYERVREELTSYGLAD